MADQTVWTISTMLKWCTEYLTKKQDEHPRLSAEWLLCATTHLSRIELYTNFDMPLSPEELDCMHDLVVRRAKGEPLQYVTGEMAFRHIILKCEPEVLIPRPETEILVDEALAYMQTKPLKNKDAIRVLEIGCGTGCIACSLAKEDDRSEVVATDISLAAAKLARRNVAALGLEERVTVIETDLVKDLDTSEKFDLLVSNPPYVPTDVIDTIPSEVKDFEPHLALDGGADGLDVFRRIVKAVPEVLHDGGHLVVELFEDKLGAAREILEAKGQFKDIRIVEDLTHRPRHICATYVAQ